MSQDAFKDRWLSTRKAHLAFACGLSVVVPVVAHSPYLALEISLLLLCLPLLLSLPQRSTVTAVSLGWPFFAGLRVLLAPASASHAFWLAVPLTLGAYSAPPLPLHQHQHQHLHRAQQASRAFLCLCALAKSGSVANGATLLVCLLLVWRRLVQQRSGGTTPYHDDDDDRLSSVVVQQETSPAEQPASSSSSTEGTLVRNAMRLAFPENPFHDKATEERIERAKLRLGITTTSHIGEGLRPDRLPVPRHLAVKLQSCRIARYVYRGRAVLVHSVPNLEVLVSEQDLECFISCVHQASQLPKLPGLMQTIGYCLSPCTFVVEELIDLHTVTLRDLILELNAEGHKLDWYFARPLLASLAETLATMHSLNNTVHRRVSISTVLLTGEHSCVLFPCAFHHAFSEVRKRFWAQPGAWDVAPEAAAAGGEYEPASDVWAFCVLAWELLVGPYTQHVTPFAMPPAVPKAIVDSIIDGIKNSADGRPSMAELWDALAQGQEEAAPQEENLVSRPVFMRVLERLNATPAGAGLTRVESQRAMMAVAAAASGAPGKTYSKGVRVSFIDVPNEGDEEI